MLMLYNLKWKKLKEES
jgi:chromosome segregation ATPase